MRSYSITLFETAIGCCALVWSEQGIAGVQLPEADTAAMRRRVFERFPEAREATPPADIAKVRDAIIALLRGERVDLSGGTLDMEGLPVFHRRVYEEARGIGPGQTLTYGALALRIGTERAARAVGQALGRNPFPILVPCHRVLATSGKLGGFSAHGGVETKRRLLEIEGFRSGAPSLFEGLPAVRRQKVEDERRAGSATRTHPSH